ncbi:cell wall hydrolase [Pelagibacterium lacus]|uniref:Cell wall hydrolase n=1 Tax=Pelagibacterium lacus TaxID=2282655 RepID=A0A369W3W8_9HYPH|nr:cell wall hydrolase [Pelagibacterium lacus]RDE09386.1 cell wall hydrolase [Pelagibacterium lacus]
MARATHAILGMVTGAVMALSVAGAAKAQEAELTAELLTHYIASTDYRPTDERKELAASEVYCLAQAVYHESRGEPESGQWAVASVILNRVESRAYPDTVCDVVFQNAHLPNRCQFSFACDGRPDDGGKGNIIDRESWVKSNLIAQIAYRQFLEGERHPDDGLTTAMHFHTTSVRPSWASAYVEVAAIGNHIFY